MNRKDEIKARLEKKRPTRVFSYIHGEGRIGVLLEIESDTDFALRNELLEHFAHEVCLQITSMAPVAINEFCKAYELKREAINSETEAPNPVIRDKVVTGKIRKWAKENILLEMPWVRDNQQTIGDLLTSLRDSLKENVEILRFARFGS